MRAIKFSEPNKYAISNRLDGPAPGREVGAFLSKNRVWPALSMFDLPNTLKGRPAWVCLY
jgi:hypothetical protein